MPTTANGNPASLCTDLLMAYQSAVVHDLRGDLNGLLLTLDFLRRQLAARPDTASLFGDSLGDLDHVRTTLTRTLNQLETVGQARRLLGGREPPTPVGQNLVGILSDAFGTLADRARRRGVVVVLPAAADAAVRADPVLLHLTLHRLLSALVDMCRNTEVRVEVAKLTPTSVRVRAVVSDPKFVPPDLLDRASNINTAIPPIPGTVLALGLTMRLAEQMGGRLTRAEGEGGTTTLDLEFPADPTEAAAEPQA